MIQLCLPRGYVVTTDPLLLGIFIIFFDLGSLKDQQLPSEGLPEGHRQKFEVGFYHNQHIVTSWHAAEAWKAGVKHHAHIPHLYPS